MNPRWIVLLAALSVGCDEGVLIRGSDGAGSSPGSGTSGSGTTGSSTGSRTTGTSTGPETTGTSTGSGTTGTSTGSGTTGTSTGSGTTGPDGGWSCAVPSFASQVVYQVGSNGSLAAADFNGDDWPDIAVSTANGLVVLYGLPDGGGLAPVTLVASGSEEQVVAGDFNGDGKIDWLLTDDGGVELLLNNYLQPPSSIQTYVPVSSYMALGYLDGDAGLDLVIGGEHHR